MKFELVEGKATAYLEGRIDSSNAQQTADGVTAELAGKNITELIFDCTKLEYISSAGLRFVLQFMKKYPFLKVINVNSEVYDIFEMTGFTQIGNISKAYRELSIEGCEVVGEGANGKVYRLDEDTIIKVYKNADALADIQRERELARAAFVSGIATAIPYDVVKVGNTYGSVFEMLNATSFLKRVKQDNGTVDDCVEKSVALLKTMHATQATSPEMPDIKQVAIGWIKCLQTALPRDEYNQILNLFTAIPDRHTVIHGDYHFKNIMLQNGETLLIDMDTLSYGDPVFEFAAIYNAYQGFGLFDKSGVEDFLGISIELCRSIWVKTVAAYIGSNDPEKIEEVENKACLIGCVRIIRRLLRRGKDDPQLQAKLDVYMNKLQEVLPEVKDLSMANV